MNKLPAQQHSHLLLLKAILRILLQLILTFIVLTLVMPASYAQDHPKKYILVLNSYHKGLSWIHTLLMDRLIFKKAPETIAVHVTCSSAKMGLNEKFRVVAQECAEKVMIPVKVKCCGFAGDRGFSHPELNESALSELKPSLLADCQSGYSNSRTCEIGLSLHGGIDYQSIVYLVDRCAERKN